jgi:two-component system chemotaxis response regulator CheY
VKQILVVDDAATVRMYHGRMLRAAGWRVDEAANGIEALEKALGRDDGTQFDLYVVDVNMPKMDGYTFVRELRAQSGRDGVPVMMVSTEAQASDALAAQRAGANCYVIKPARPQDLVLTAALLLGDLQAARSAACIAGGAHP